MALAGPPLAEAIRSAMGFPSPTSKQLKGWAQAVVDEVLKGIATFGVIPSGHTISGLVGPRLAKGIADASGYPNVSPELLKYAGAITAYIMSSAIVTYVGPPPTPVPPEIGFRLGGTISGLVGAALAAKIASATGYPGVSPELLKKCDAIVKYIMANALVNDGIIT